MKKFAIIAAFRTKDRGIGYNNTVPWNKPNDLAFFRKETTKDCKDNEKNMVIMGRYTFESLHCKSLKNRINVVITSQPLLWKMKEYTDVYFVSSLHEALTLEIENCIIKKCFVIGGEQLYFEAINHEKCDELIISVICDSENNDIICDRFFPPINYDLYFCKESINSENGVMIVRYNKKQI